MPIGANNEHNVTGQWVLLLRACKHLLCFCENVNNIKWKGVDSCVLIVSAYEVNLKTNEWRRTTLIKKMQVTTNEKICQSDYLNQDPLTGLIGDMHFHYTRQFFRRRMFYRCKRRTEKPLYGVYLFTVQ